MWLLLAVVGARCRAQLTLLNVVVPSVVMMLSAVAASVVVVDFGALWWCDRPRWPVPLQVYLDDMMSGFNVSSNTFFNVSRAFLLGGDTMWHTHSSRSLSFFSWHVTVTVNKTITKEDHFRDLPDTARRDSRGNSPHASPDWFEINRLVVSSGLFQVAVRTFLRTTRSTAAISAKATGRRGSGLAPFSARTMDLPTQTVAVPADVRGWSVFWWQLHRQWHPLRRQRAGLGCQGLRSGRVRCQTTAAPACVHATSLIKASVRVTTSTNWEFLSRVPYASALWAARYGPLLGKIKEDGICTPKYNVIGGNGERQKKNDSLTQQSRARERQGKGRRYTRRSAAKVQRK